MDIYLRVRESGALPLVKDIGKRLNSDLIEDIGVLLLTAETHEGALDALFGIGGGRPFKPLSYNRRHTETGALYELRRQDGDQVARILGVLEDEGLYLYALYTKNSRSMRDMVTLVRDHHRKYRHLMQVVKVTSIELWSHLA